MTSTLVIFTVYIPSLPCFFPVGYKVIYTDYNNTVIHVCLGSNPNGSCEKSSEQVTILSRTADMDVSRRSELRDIVSQDLCMDVTDLVDVEHKGIQFGLNDLINYKFL